MLAAVPTALGALKTLLERAESVRTQQRFDKNKLYALHAPEVECVGKGKARRSRLMDGNLQSGARQGSCRLIHAANG